MYVLAGGAWRDGFLDYHCGTGELRLQVRAWQMLERLDDVYLVRPRSLRLLWNYLREVGPVQVLRKIVSRSDERFRNEKFVSCGWGSVLDAGHGTRYRTGEDVYFMAPLHPACVQRLVVPEVLTSPAPHPLFRPTDANEVRHLGIGSETGRPVWWRDVRGWSPYSGAHFDADRRGSLFRRVRESLESADWDSAARLKSCDPEPVEGRPPAAGPPGDGRPRGVLFGYGNYAKTQALPNIAPFVRVERIHEIDPLQIPIRGGGTGWNTAPGPVDDQEFDVWMLAGYHHTHAPLAIEALRRGAYAVVEKPIATTPGQLGELLEALVGRERLFSCYHKRYMPLNTLARRDLGVSPGDPVSYHCIVFEVPLPALHWYRWPNSGSRIVSNGCHWIDHFLFLNEWSPVASSDVSVARDGTINASVELQNGAFFSMTLTDVGSSRLGVQDLVELRARGTTVRMLNGGDYFSEDGRRVLRRARINKLSSYAMMYREIGRRIRAGLPGDSLLSVERSAGLVLALEAALPTDGIRFSTFEPTSR
jgi:predicted dehydrogenase